ncbi:MAG: Uncharacterized protein Athens101428_513 [Candidatus Berkelbacteria bacterium Athens1014_28]|uniref:Predicted membrane protein YciQ-like C-terminal domain-containing protein n=1 Tax=Candidatus Berkelbacteria bacterium Athens1014_28 TaxID=2017145 RepID=A0A554LMN5_9BACT|nr:MAG: Uncharacterized protein Athens101428_513 [Candidatus Berkelbacteria bacterium Athens1014_28]
MEKKYQKPPIIGLNWRKLIFFSCLFVAFFSAWKIVEYNQFLADEATDAESNYLFTSVVNLEVTKDGKIFSNGKKIAGSVKPQKEFDELRLVVYDQNGTYLDNLQIQLSLPSAVAGKTKSEILAIHGVDSSTSSVYGDNVLLYEASGVSAVATITIVAKLPKGEINFSFIDQLVYYFSTFSGTIWLSLAVFLPLVVFVYLIILILLQRKAQTIPSVERQFVSPPSALPPAVVGVLTHQDIGAREIAATLVDLSLRKLIFIIDKDRGFAFGKRDFTQQILPFEKILLSKIFRNEIVSREEMIKERFYDHLYSKKMSLFTGETYSIATRFGYFKVNPKSMRRKYQFFGTIFFFFALLCFFLSLKYFPTLHYASFLWVGMMVSSAVIIIVGSKIPIRTPLGRQALGNWLAFRAYLSDHRPLPLDQQNYDKFVEYLPYAIVFNCEALWVRRFSFQKFAIPEWFLTDKEGIGLDDFCLALFPIIGYVGQNLATIREPGYK